MHNIDQCKTDEDGQTMGEGLRHVQKAVAARTYVKEANVKKGRQAETNAIISTTFHYKNK